MAAVAAAVAAATTAVISFWMALEKAMTSLSILSGFRILVPSSLLSAELFFDTRIPIVLVLRRSQC